ADRSTTQPICFCHPVEFLRALRASVVQFFLPMQETLTALVAKAQTDLAALKTRPEFEAAKARLVGPNGELTALMKQMGSVPKDQRPAIGKLINETKTQLQSLLDATLARIE